MSSLRDAMSDTTVSCTETTITIECGSHETKEIVVDVLTSGLDALTGRREEIAAEINRVARRNRHEGGSPSWNDAVETMRSECIDALLSLPAKTIEAVLALPHTGQPVEGPLREALKSVRQELWVDECLRVGRTDFDPATFNSRPHIRIIDAALSPAPASPHEVHERETPLTKSSARKRDDAEL